MENRIMFQFYQIQCKGSSGTKSSLNTISGFSLQNTHSIVLQIFMNNAFYFQFLYLLLQQYHKSYPPEREQGPVNVMPIRC